MTIASHCLSLIREHGPLSAEELGAACLADGVTLSRRPDYSVASALSWNMDGRALRVGDRFHAVSQLLEGRWLTLRRSADEPVALDPAIDLACLAGVIGREGLPLADGGTLTGRRYTYEPWTGPDGWLPAGETVGLRLMDGIAALRAVDIDAAAERRGERLAELLTERGGHRNYGSWDRRDAAGRGLLALLAEDDELLREPVPPLSSLLPAPPDLRQDSWDGPPPFWPTVHLHLPPELHAYLDHLAGATGAQLDHWLADQLAWLADSPLLNTLARASERAAYDRGARFVDDGHEDSAWNSLSSVLPFARPTRSDHGAS